MKSGITLALAAVASLHIFASPALAGDRDWDRATLAGVASVNVLVEGISGDLKSAGLSIETIQTDAELRLRSAGLRVATEFESFSLPGSPYLYVNVSGFRDVTTAGRPLGLSATVDVSFVQYVRLQRNASIQLAAPTWSVRETVGGSSAEVVRKSLRDLVDRFANAYLSVNPK